MKTQKGIREHEADELHKAKRLAPILKSGKERYSLHRSYDDSFDEREEEDFIAPRESVLDYFDDEEEDSD